MKFGGETQDDVFLVNHNRIWSFTHNPCSQRWRHNRQKSSDLCKKMDDRSFSKLDFYVYRVGKLAFEYIVIQSRIPLTHLGEVGL